MADDILLEGEGLKRNCEQDMNKREKEEEAVEEGPKGDGDAVVARDEAPPEASAEEKLKGELFELQDRFIRLAADFENYKKAKARESTNQMRYANENLIHALLPGLDSLEQAVLAAKRSEAKNDDVLVGVEMVLKQLKEALAKFGVEVFSAHGQPFDPSRHEAMGEQDDDTCDAGTVIMEYQKGYMLHDRLLRPARVVVSKRPKG